MKWDAIKRQGSRTDLTSRPMGEKLLSVDEIANSTFYKALGNYADACIMMLMNRRQLRRKFAKTFRKEYSFFRIGYLDFSLIIHVISSKDILKLLLSVFIIEI